MPARDNSILRNVMTALSYAQGDALYVCPRIINPHEKELNKKTSIFSTLKNIDLAGVRHHRFEAEVATGDDTGVAALIGEPLRLRDPRPIWALERKRDVVRIDVFAEIGIAL